MIYDLQVLPNQNPARGDVSFLTETELLQDLESALAAHANDFKVWNLSLGSDEVCSLDEFSSFAVELDRLQEKYNVSFVISAGNYSRLPMLSYPRTGEQLISGRITTPADSVLGIAVGSISHHSHHPQGPKRNEPSAFSRHGAGPNFIIKPDLVHYGGCCACDSSDVRGVRSLEEAGTSEGIGTSYSAPLISRLLANIYHQITPSPSPVLARALLTHNAAHPGSNSRVPDSEENFLGFGLPRGLSTALECEPWSSTLIFEDQLRPGYYLEWDDFPYPDCLKSGGKFLGQIAMTLAFAPSRGANWGAEYCETHIEANFGVYQRRRSRDTGAVSLQFKGLVPPEHKNPGILYESYQIEKLRKWAPVRTYFGDLGENGVRGERWRLKVRLLCRHGIDDQAAFSPQRFALIVAISDPTHSAAVYNEMAVKIRSRFSAANLSLRPTLRIQSQGEA